MNELNALHGLWLHYVMCSGFSDRDSFHCIEPDKEACDFCPHCAIDERCEISGHFERNPIWFACWWCRWVPKERKNHDSVKYVWFDQIREHDRYFIWFGFMFPVELCIDTAKYVWYDEFRLHQHYKGGYEICKDWEDIEK